MRARDARVNVLRRQEWGRGELTRRRRRLTAAGPTVFAGDMRWGGAGDAALLRVSLEKARIRAADGACVRACGG